jgi:hypothetical protein
MDLYPADEDTIDADLALYGAWTQIHDMPSPVVQQASQADSPFNEGSPGTLGSPEGPWLYSQDEGNDLFNDSQEYNREL